MHPHFFGLPVGSQFSPASQHWVSLSCPAGLAVRLRSGASKTGGGCFFPAHASTYFSEHSRRHLMGYGEASFGLRLACEVMLRQIRLTTRSSGPINRFAIDVAA